MSDSANHDAKFYQPESTPAESDQHPILPYATPEKPSLGRFDGYVTALAILMVALIVPIPEFAWYFGQHPQRVLSVNDGILYFGRTDNQAVVPYHAVLCVKLFAIGFPAWLVSRFRQQFSSKTRAVEKESHG